MTNDPITWTNTSPITWTIPAWSELTATTNTTNYQMQVFSSALHSFSYQKQNWRRRLWLRMVRR